MRKIESKLRLSFVFQSFQPLIEHPKQYEEALQTTSNSKSFIFIDKWWVIPPLVSLFPCQNPNLSSVSC